MALRIQSNQSSINAMNNLSKSTAYVTKHQQKLSTGFRINQAGDDSAGLNVSETLRAQQRGIEKASGNVQDGINLLNTLDSAYATITDSIQRARDLAVQAANDTYSTPNRTAMSTELAQIEQEIERIVQASEFNGISLLNANTSAVTLQIGQNSTGSQNTLDVNPATAVGNIMSFSLDSTVSGEGLLDYDVFTGSDARETIRIADELLSEIGNRRSNIGGLVNRLELTAENLLFEGTNVAAAESQIRNVDFASETAEFAGNQVRQQASVSILAQANQSSNIALSLL